MLRQKVKETAMILSTEFKISSRLINSFKKYAKLAYGAKYIFYMNFNL
jgi:hypothetical protein